MSAGLPRNVRPRSEGHGPRHWGASAAHERRHVDVVVVAADIQGGPIGRSSGTLTASTGSNNVEVSLPAFADSIRCAPVFSAAPPSSHDGLAADPGGVEAGRDDGDAHSALLERVVGDGAEDDLGVGWAAR